MLLETENLGSYTSSIEARSVYEIPAVGDEANNNNHNNNNIEIINNLDENGFTIARGTPIQDFYDGQSIFITGATGFLGKLLTEKLLRSCPNISTIYLLIRKKKDKSMEDRIEDLFNNPIYDRLRKESPKFRHKIVGISGDCSVQGLGLNATDRERLLREVSIVIHSAATVRFDEKIDTALAINVRSTLDMIDLCKSMTRLKAFIHVSTAYANCHLPIIEETFYPHTMVYEDLEKSLQGLGDDEIEKITPKILGKWPNTYTFTKALAEVVVKERSKGLTVGIVRPAIVISSAEEPIPGWTDNFYGPTGAVTAVVSGILRTLQFNDKSGANVVPVDYTVNAIIASAWDVANQIERRDDKMLIYNYVSTVDYSISWEQYCRINMKHAKKYPLNDAKWAVSLTIHSGKTMNTISRILLHYTPALIVDLFSICLGQRPNVRETPRSGDLCGGFTKFPALWGGLSGVHLVKPPLEPPLRGGFVQILSALFAQTHHSGSNCDFMVVCVVTSLIRTYRKIHKFMDVLTWFCNNDWTFTHDNVVDMWKRLDTKDKKIFRFSLKELDLDNFFQNYMKGIRVHLLKDDLSTLEVAKKRARRFEWMHQLMKTLILIISFWALWKIFCAVFF